MLREIARTTAKVFLLILLINFEYAIGMPFLFVLFSISWFRKIEGAQRVILLVIFSLLLAVVYSMSFAFSLIVLTLAGILYVFGEKIVRDRQARLLLSSTLVMLIMWGVYRFDWGWNVVFQLGAELVLLWIGNTLYTRKYHGYKK